MLQILLNFKIKTRENLPVELILYLMHILYYILGTESLKTVYYRQICNI